MLCGAAGGAGGQGRGPAWHARRVAQAYLEYLFSPEGQKIAAENYYRPQLKSVSATFVPKNAKTEFVTIQSLGGWQKAQKTHFADGGVFDQIYQPGS